MIQEGRGKNGGFKAGMKGWRQVNLHFGLKLEREKAERRTTGLRRCRNGVRG